MVSVRETLDRAHTLFQRGSTEAATDLLERTLRLRPDSGELWEALGLFYFAADRCEPARVCLEKAANFVELSHQGRQALADCDRRIEVAEAARAMNLPLTKCESTSSKPSPTAAPGQAAKSQAELMLDMCREAARRNPESDQALYGVAYYMSRCGYSAESILPILELVLDLAPEVVRYRIALVIANSQIGHRRRAMELLRPLTCKQLSLVGCASCLKKLGALFHAMGDEERACFCFDRLRDNPRRSGC